MSYAQCSAIAIALLLSTTVQAQAPSAAQANDAQAAQSIQAYCASEWQSDTTIQSRCASQQSEARTKAMQFAAASPAERDAIWSRCSRDWTNHNGFLDWIMMSRCVNFQVEAYKQ